MRLLFEHLNIRTKMIFSVFSQFFHLFIWLESSVKLNDDKKFDKTTQNNGIQTAFEKSFFFIHCGTFRFNIKVMTEISLLSF